MIPIKAIKKILCLILAALIFIVPGCKKTDPPQNGEIPLVSGENSLSASVIYDSSVSDGAWRDTLGYLSQALVLGVNAEGVDVSREDNIGKFDLVYLDSSLASSSRAESVRDEVTALVSNGAVAVLANELYEMFGKDFIGAYGFEKLSDYPYGMSALDAGEEFSYIQDIITDFSYLYQNYPEFAEAERTAPLHSRDYGYMVSCDTAKPIIGYGSYALYTANDFGKGCVFFTSPLLPNFYSISGFSMAARDEQQAAFASTTASCNQLLINAFAEYAFMRRYGYSMSRVFGSFGGSNMAWELHYEELTAFENGSAQIFGEMCRNYRQIPSFTLIRNTYTWFLRSESVTSLLNSSPNGHTYNMDFNESAYSSGTHVAENGAWLALSSIENGGSYFADYPEYDFRAVPALGDFDGDGLIDIISGSEDGKLYFFKGEGYSDRLKVSARRVLDFSAPGYSAPCAFDLDGDGKSEILLGGEDGRVLWAEFNDSLELTGSGVLCDTGLAVQVMPAAGDINGDGEPDIIIGAGDGRIFALFSPSSEPVDISNRIENLSELGAWLSPTVYDYNGDGLNDLVIGTFDGYIALRYGSEDGKFTDGGYIKTNEKNYKGNNNLKFANYCSPRFCDINGDGADDLICGSLEYGMAIPIDSEYFPYREELREQLDYMRENDFYCGVHFYTNEFASEKREAYELEAHMASRAAYGLGSERIGANQHTWYTSSNDTAQSFLSLWNSGILWDSGFMTANAESAYPQQNAQNVISLPFFLERGGEKSILIQNNSTLLYSDPAFTNLSAKYDMPMCMYYHCDFAYRDPDAARGVIETAEEFREVHDYNFVGEDQMMLASAAAYNLSVSSSVSPDGTLTISPSYISGEGALYDENYQSSCGIRLRFAPGTDISRVYTSSAVRRERGGALYISLEGETVIKFNFDEPRTRLLNINIPAEIELFDSGASLSFKDDGMMQFSVLGKAETDADGWDIKHENGITVFTKFGKAENISVKYTD